MRKLAIACLALCLSCGSKQTSLVPPGEGTAAQPAAANDKVLVQIADLPAGLLMRLSEGRDQLAPPDRSNLVPAKKLADADALKLLTRLPALVVEATDRKDFALRERSLPPPRTGRTVAGAFPPPVPKDAPVPGTQGGPLEVLRAMPEGAVPLAPNLTVTFNQPMVAVTSHATTIAGGVPVTLTPLPPGQWRWIGTRSLVFDPKDRFPMATEYRVEIAAGTPSAVGGKLAAARSWTFSLPPPQVQQSWPNDGPQRLEPVMFLAFDQAIDPDAVLATVSIDAAGHRYRLRPATDAEIEADATVRQLVAAEKDARFRRWLAFRAIEPFPVDTQINVSVGPGTPSTEGPLTTTAVQRFGFRTYGPLKVVEARCAWGDRCPPLTPWYIRMSNPLDDEAFDPSQIAIEPALGGLKTELYGDSIYLRGNSAGRTTYKVTLPATLTDTFGQKLGHAETLTFRVGSADPTLYGPAGLVVLDPAAKPAYSVFTINHRSLHVRAYAVGPAEWNDFADLVRNYDDARRGRGVGKKVIDTTVKVGGEADQLIETKIDLAPALTGGLGHVLLIIEPTARGRYPEAIIAWVEATHLGLDAFVDGQELRGFATSLLDGRPEEGVRLEVLPAGAGGGPAVTSGADGLGTVGLAPARGKGRSLLVARKGADVAILPENVYWWNEEPGWVRQDAPDALSWFIFDDRGMYKPGETVSVKGWIRRFEMREGGDIAALRGAAREVTWKLFDPVNNDIATGKASLSALGGFDFKLTLPKTVNLGSCRLELTAAGDKAVEGRVAAHFFQVQEFRRPEYEVTATASQGPFLIGGSADVAVKASYYAGGGLVGAETSWQLTASEAYFTPPNRSDFTFGTWVPWWRSTSGGGQSMGYGAKTDAAGMHRLHIDFLSVNPPRPMTVNAQATVVDVNRQAWASSAMLLVHPAELYVGLRTQRIFLEQGKPLDVDAVAVDLDGKAVLAQPIAMRAVRLDWTYKKGEWKEEQLDPQECRLPSAADPITCTFATAEGGTYRVTATVVDGQGRPNQTELTVWVGGGNRPPARDVSQEEIVLIPDRKEYQPGDTATILVQAPFYPAEGVLTLRRSGLVEARRFTMRGPSTTLAIPIVEAYLPNIYAQVDLVGGAVRSDDDGKPLDTLPRRPAFATGQLDLPIPPLARKLAVTVAPRDKALEPGGQTTLDIDVKDAGGKPVGGAELAVVVVDESILALTPYATPNPLALFYGERPGGVRDAHLREYVKLARPEVGSFAEANVGGDAAPGMVAQTAAMGTPPPPPPAAPEPEAAPRRMAKGEADDGSPAGSTPIAVRSNFDPLAVFAPAVPTDAGGHAKVPVKLPDNLTRYRIMVVAVAGDKQFGAGESAVTARMPLMVRPSPPRFLNFGDRFELPIVLQNQTDVAMTVDVAVRAGNAALTDGMGRRVEVPANDRVEVRIPAAAQLAGTARFQIAAASGRYADAAELSLPVWTPATTEAFAVYGEVDSGAIRQPVLAPPDAVTSFGGLEVTTSSTELQALTDAVLYLVAYPYECAEQLSSRVLAVAALRDVLDAFHAEGLPSKDKIEAAVARDLDRLAGLQNYDGGFAFWQRGDESWPYVSIHVAHALVRAKEKGFAVKPAMLERSKEYLREIESHIPGYYPIDVRRTLVAYALYVRKRMGDPDVAKARSVLHDAGLDKLPLEATGWLYAVLTGDAGSATDLAAIRKHLNNRVSEEAGTAHFVTSYSDGGHLLLHSDRRVDGILLEALIGDQPKSDLIPKIVRGLLAHRTAGHWENTQENAFVLLALDRYFHVYENVTPNFVARIWLGNAFAGEHAFKGRTTERHQVDVPMSYLAKAGGGKPQDLVLGKEGAGRMYYRIGMTYAPKDLVLAPSDHGFVVERRYEAVDDPADVRRLDDGTWKVKAGARVRVRVSMVAESRRYQVALVDPLPAGLEAMNPALAVTGAVPQDPKEQQGAYWWWYRTWYEFQNLRDERVEAFTSLLWDGVYDYTYVARATTPGTFVVPPAKAEEMYHPETFGRSASDRFIVE